MQDSGPCMLTPSVTGRCLAWTYSELSQRSSAPSGVPHRARTHGAGCVGCGRLAWLWPNGCAALRCAARLTWHDLGPSRTRHRHDPGRTRTCTCRFRRATPYPSGHRAKWKRSDQHSMVLGQHGKDSDHDCAQKAPRTAVRPWCWSPSVFYSMALRHRDAHCCSFVIVCRRPALPAARETRPRCLCACLLF